MNKYFKFCMFNSFRISGSIATFLYISFIGIPLVALLYAAISDEEFLVSLSNPMVYKALYLSLYTSAISMFIIVIVGTPVGYILAHNTKGIFRVVDILIELPIVLPPVVAGIALLMAFGNNGILGQFLVGMGISLPFTTVAVIFAQIFVSAPFYVRAARIGFQSVPRTYEDIAQTLGSTPMETFWRISLPLTWQALLGGLALSWARALSEFGATIMFAGSIIGKTQTLPLATLRAMETDITFAIAISVLALLISVSILFFLGLMASRPSYGRSA
ncbi:MAG: molybdate ABC transporter permease subunit [SAR202 cluster bacterium]|nr:molybdate ABC transporter permease subunit [SAR202 cluster bacterium]|tara:strand:+ start:33411 stop:34232 length:822 start_codon:yes stop_codon:yes gene_type:complete